jgi:predicted Zn finger-like uncharacterized protein
MPGEKYTRCPGCSTVFRVTLEQLALRGGQVRCGQCKTVFNGIAQQVSLAVPNVTQEPLSEGALGPPTLTLRNAASLEAPILPPPTAPPGRPADAAATAAAANAATALPGEPIAPEAPPVDRFAPPAATSRRRRTIAYVVAIVALLLLLAAQAVYHFRDSIVTFWPITRQAFERVCEAAGCAIRPLRDAAMSYLSIESSDLQADPAHRGLLILTATIRNRASWPLAYPHLELTLTDAQDTIVVRRALAPADYAGGTADVAQGIVGNGEISLKVFIDASATTQAGYRLYMFYP